MNKVIRDLAIIVSIIASVIFVGSVSAGSVMSTSRNIGITDGLVLHYTFDTEDTDWTTYILDNVAGAFDGIIHSSMSTTSDPVMGAVGTAFDFDGVDDQILVGDVDAVDVGTGNFSLSFFASGGTLNDQLIGKDSWAGTGNGLRIVTGSGGNPGTYYWNGSVLTTLINTSSQYLLHHIAVVRTGTGAAQTILYVDGVQINAIQDSRTLSNAFDFVIANSNDGGRNFNGVIDDVRFYNRALSSDEILRLYRVKGGQQLSSGFEDTTDLVGHWTFDTGKVDFANNLAFDETGKNNGTLVSMSSANQVQGKLGKGLEFDGVNDYVDHSSALPARANDTTGTISMWIKPTSDNAKEAIYFDIGPLNSTASTHLYLDLDWRLGNNAFKFGAAKDGIDQWYVSGPNDSATPYLNQWVHITITHDGVTPRTYINGVDSGFTFIVSTNKTAWIKSVATDATTKATKIITGGYNYSSGPILFFPGSIDDVRIYNRALTATEVAELYTNLAPTYISTTVPSVEDGLVGHWTFDGPDTDWGTNTTNDISGEGNTGTMTNMSTTTSPTPGRLGQGLEFDGVDGYVDAGDISSLDSAQKLTLSAWAKRSMSGSSVWVTKEKDGINNRVALGLWIDGYFYVEPTGSAGYARVSLADTDWHHLVMVFDGTQSGDSNRLKGYVDGVEVSLSYAGGTVASVTNNMAGSTFDIGRSPAYGYSNGIADDVRIYNRALSASEIQTLYRMGN
ncbi:MAG: LamG domain-containing protein [bacterium]|nr:LamG domain-containing protein [bacterium]